MMWNDKVVEEMNLCEINAVLNCVASRKCRAKNAKEKREWEAFAKQVKAVKDAKFGRKKYADYSRKEIEELGLEEVEKGLASLRSKRARLGDNAEKVQEVLKLENVWLEVRDAKKEQKMYEEMKKKFEK